VAGPRSRLRPRRAAAVRLEEEQRAKEFPIASDEDETDDSQRKRLSLSWTAMLCIVLLAILAAAGCAYLLVNPFFHQHPPGGQ